jgi:hypothetical protein
MQAFQHAATLALPHVRLFRREILKATIEGRHVRAGLKGQCDLYGIVRGGLHVEVETKALGGRLRPEQKVWREWCERGEVPYLLLTVPKGEEPDATVTRWVSELRALVDSKNGQA